jgi:RecB family exonuclease
MQFLNCPLDYKYRYYLRLPMPGGAALSFGSTIHAVFEEYMEIYRNSLHSPQRDLFDKTAKKAELPPFELLEHLYEKNWIDDWYQSKAQKNEYKKKGREILKNFYDATILNPPVPKYIETPFKLEIGDEKHHFTGKIDRADNASGDSIDIMDYKTGKPPKGKAGDLDQLRIYQWAAEEYLHEKVNSLCYWYVDSNESSNVPIATPQEIDKLKSDLLETIEKIRHTITYDLFAELHRKTKQHSCDFAEYL